MNQFIDHPYLTVPFILNTWEVNLDRPMYGTLLKHSK